MARLPSLKAVRYFTVAARHRSFTVAAHELSVTQGAVSRMILTLEEELGVRLFTRTGRTLSMTPAGKRFYGQVSVALQQIENASDQVRESVKEESLPLILNSNIATRWLVPRLPDFLRAHPEININILGSEMDAQLNGNLIPMAIRYGEPPWPGCDARRLSMGSILGVLCTPELLLKYKVREPKDLISCPLLAYTGSLVDPWVEYFRHFGLEPPKHRQGPKFSSMLMLAEAGLVGLGFALVPLFLFESELRSERFVLSIPHTVESEHGYFIVHSKSAVVDDKSRLFKQWLLASAEYDPSAIVGKSS